MARKTQYIRVKNSTGRAIQKGALTHATEDYGIQTISLDGLEDSTYSETIEMYSDWMNRDYWWVTWSNDGLNFVAFNTTNPIHEHETMEIPGTIELFGTLGNADLAINFLTDRGKKDRFKIKNPWD